jgi:hypothetical protein
MPPTGSFTAEFTGCLYFCAPGYYGATDIATSFECTDRCPAGHFCEEGTAVPMPCEVGTFNPVIMGPSTQSCISCSPGTYNNEMGRAEACIPCPPGSLSGSPGAVTCGPCPSGGFCAAQGAASLQQTFTPCKAGTFNPLNGSSSNASCLACPPGTVNPIPGSTSLKVCRECLPGSVAPVNGTANCILCPGGFFQKAKGATSCKPCEVRKDQFALLAQWHQCHAKREATRMQLTSRPPLNAKHARQERAALWVARLHSPARPVGMLQIQAVQNAPTAPLELTKTKRGKQSVRRAQKVGPPRHELSPD